MISTVEKDIHEMSGNLRKINNKILSRINELFLLNRF